MAEDINKTVAADVPASEATQLPDSMKPWAKKAVVNTTTAAPAAPKPTANVETDITVNTVPPTSEEAITESIGKTQEALVDAPVEKMDRTIEEAVQRDDQITQATEFAKESEDIIKKQDEQLRQVEEEVDTLAQERQDRDVWMLEAKRLAEMDKAQLIVEEQRLTNQAATLEAEVKIETAKQQSVWAYNKLWLGFSSGIINEVQRIATKGANELARVKVTGAKHLADTQLKVAELEFKYAAEINTTIDKYTDLQLSNKQNTIKRITDTNNNILLNNRQKEENINKAKEEYKTDKRKLEDDMRKENERLSDKLVQQSLALENKVVAEQNQVKTDINRQFQNGSWFNLTERQKGLQLVKAWLWLEEGKAMEDTLFSKTITKEVADTVGSNVTLTWTDRKEIQLMSENYMEGWLVFEEATKRATLDYITTNPRLSRVKKLQDAKLKSALAPKSVGTWVSKPSDKNLQIKIDEKWRQLEYDREQNVWKQSVDIEWNKIFASKKETLADVAKMFIDTTKQ